MASPFPGLDPYLEVHWGDVHASLVIYIRDWLRDRLPGDLLARVEERVALLYDTDQDRHIIPDIRVLERRREGSIETRTFNGTLAVAEPFVMTIAEPVTEGYIEIRERGANRRLVTVIEVLSLTNKLRGRGREKFEQKQDELRKAGVSLVEIDLLRYGGRKLPFAVEYLPPEHRTPYGVLVERVCKRDRLEIYRIPLRERLPVIGIPLREKDPDVPLDLQALIDQCYRNGSYDDDLDYNRDPDPQLTGADARWADRLLKEAGRRTRSGRKKSKRA